MKILVHIIAEPIWTMPPAQVDRLQSLFPGHLFVNAESDERAAAEIRDADVDFSSVLTPSLFASATKLRWVHSPAAGVGRLLFPELRKSQVVLTNSRGVHGVPIAEHVFGLAIALSRKFNIAAVRQHQHKWAKDEIGHVLVLHGQRLGIVGLGSIGSAIARLGVAFGMHVAGLKRRPEEPASVEGIEKIYGPKQLDELLAWSDYLVLSAPLTSETAGLIGARELRVMKRSAFLINIARGKLIREKELAAELHNGTIAGAGLDVFEHEPLDPASPLWDLPNVIITPHTSGFFQNYWEAIADLFAENLRRFDRGERLLNVVDKNAGY